MIELYKKVKVVSQFSREKFKGSEGSFIGIEGIVVSHAYTEEGIIHYVSFTGLDYKVSIGFLERELENA